MTIEFLLVPCNLELVFHIANIGLFFFGKNYVFSPICRTSEDCSVSGQSVYFGLVLSLEPKPPGISIVESRVIYY